jgi:glutamate/tyrosine decarboxylase-like PLP-dependent enzyme
MANFVCFLAARRAKTPWDVRVEGASPAGRPRLRAYASSETHTWVQKACDLFGLGTDALRWIPVDDELVAWTWQHSRRRSAKDRERGDHPFLVVGTAGSVSTGAVDPLFALAEICKREDLWLHADGAYGGLAAPIPGVPDDLRGSRGRRLRSPSTRTSGSMRRSRRAALSCASRAPWSTPSRIVLPTTISSTTRRDPRSTFYERGPRTRAGSVPSRWLGLRQAGREGYMRSIAEDIRLARRLYDKAAAEPRLQAFTHGSASRRSAMCLKECSRAHRRPRNISTGSTKSC